MIFLFKIKILCTIVHKKSSRQNENHSRHYVVQQIFCLRLACTSSVSLYVFHHKTIPLTPHNKFNSHKWLFTHCLVLLSLLFLYYYCCIQLYIRKTSFYHTIKGYISQSCLITNWNFPRQVHSHQETPSTIHPTTNQTKIKYSTQI